jgi:hypothetical protein
MKRASGQSIRDSKEIARQSKIAARLLEDLAVHADNDEERQRCLAVAKDLRSAAHSTARKSKLKKSRNQA